MHQASFDSSNIDAVLTDKERFSLWCETLESLTCHVDITRFEDRPFSAFLHWADFGDFHVTHFGGTFGRIRRSRTSIARGPNDDFCLAYHCGEGTFEVEQANREARIRPGNAFLGCNGIPADLRSASPITWTTITIARDRLAGLVEHTDTLLTQPIDASRPAVAHLRRYTESVVTLARTPHDPHLDSHIGTTLLDLMALVLGAKGDAAHLATTRGLRAARIQDIVAEIDRSFAHPAFSIQQVSRRLGLSTRYIQDLLQETGRSFSERLLERRLQHARKLLTSEEGDRLKVGEIAYASGFGEISYFNQRFRRRFGASPRDFRR